MASATAYTITATNSTSSTTQTFTLTVTAVPVVVDNSAAQAEATRRANEQREWGDLSEVVPLINELLKEMEEDMKGAVIAKKKSPTIKTKQNIPTLKKSEQEKVKLKNQAKAKQYKKK